MARREKKSNTPRPVGRTQFAAWRGDIQSDFLANADRAFTVLLDKEALPALHWLEAAVRRLKATPNHPREVTGAAQALEKEMAEAFRRRQCDGQWSWGHIKNTMITLDLWPRTRPRKG
jgi:hypothetical protein